MNECDSVSPWLGVHAAGEVCESQRIFIRGLRSNHMAFAEIIILLVEWYLYVGIAVALAFIIYGVDKIDEAAHGTFLFRLLILPGLVGLWPLVIVMWRRHLRAGGV